MKLTKTFQKVKQRFIDEQMHEVASLSWVGLTFKHHAQLVNIVYTTHTYTNKQKMTGPEIIDGGLFKMQFRFKITFVFVNTFEMVNKQSLCVSGGTVEHMLRFRPR